MQNRQLVIGVLLAMCVLFGYQLILRWLYPQAFLPPPNQPTATQPVEPPAPGAGTTRAAESAPGPPPGRRFEFTAGLSRDAVVIGDRPDDALGLTLTPRGAGVEAIRLTSRQKNRYVYRAEAGKDAPYEILDPDTLRAAAPQATVPASFATHRITVEGEGERGWPLDELVWNVAEATAEKAAFTTTLLATDGDEQLLRLTKTYELQSRRPTIVLSLTIENVSGQPLSVSVEQDGPAHIRREAEMYDMRRLLAAHSDGQATKLAKTVQRSELQKKAAAGEKIRLFASSSGSDVLRWVALTNRFFGVFVRPLADRSTPSNFVQCVDGSVVAPDSSANLGDLLGRLISTHLPVPAGGQVRQVYEIYVGPKDPQVLAALGPEFKDPNGLNYGLAHSADNRCCTFEPLPTVMTTLLHWIQFVVRNFGIAIIILVVIVRTCLHPLSVYQQKQMFRMQDGMARLQPKLEAIKEQYKNDKVRLNQEMMKLYADEGVNPMASFVGMLPLFIQMPILVALWTGLNTDIALRHAPFDGWWIRDLAAPDELIKFASPISIPILAQLPLLGGMFRDIPALNLLPVLMGISMWLQQKYMPKPGMQAKAEAAKQHPPRQRKPGQLSPEDQLRQQQMVGYMMTIMMPLMFYYMPSGLNLYWMATTVFGIGETLIIRKQLKEEKEKRAREGPKPLAPRRPGLVGRWMKKIAEQAEEIQRRADELSDQNRPRPRRDDDKDPKKR